jgi:hypothetical protein
LKETFFLTTDKDDTVLYQWRDPPDRWNWQTRFATFSRPHHHTATHTHLFRALTSHTRNSLYSDGTVYPVYLTGQVLPPIHEHSHWFTLTAATPTLKGKLFSDFFDSEMGSGYTLTEEPRD